MKKILLAFMAAGSFFIASAQNNHNNGGDDDENEGGGNQGGGRCENCAVSKTPNGPVDNVRAHHLLELKVHKMICLSPKNGGKLSATVDKPEQLNEGKVKLTGSGDDLITYQVSANIPVRISLFGSPVSYNGPASGPISNPFWQKMESSDPDVSIASIASSYFQLGNMPNAAQITPGADNEFSFRAKAEVDWTTPTGIYEQTINVVASAL